MCTTQSGLSPSWGTALEVSAGLLIGILTVIIHRRKFCLRWRKSDMRALVAYRRHYFNEAAK